MFSDSITIPVRDVLHKKSKLKLFSNTSDVPQQQGTPENIGELSKNGDIYHVIYNSQSIVKIPDMGYIYIVPASTPWKILCARMSAVQGHTSLGRENISIGEGKYKTIIGDVYYAGEMSFTNGVLDEWNNHSGHYKPQAELAGVNFLPHIQKMLPFELFTTRRISMNRLMLPPPPPPPDFSKLMF